MRTAEERKTLLHRRSMELEKDRLRAGLRRTALASFALSVMLFFTIGWFGGTDHTLYTMSFSGSSLLGENAGGYVLTAVVSFTVAVVITVFLMKRRK